MLRKIDTCNRIVATGEERAGVSAQARRLEIGPAAEVYALLPGANLTLSIVRHFQIDKGLEAADQFRKSDDVCAESPSRGNEPFQIGTVNPRLPIRRRLQVA